jgi:signal transduction histidine kinase
MTKLVATLLTLARADANQAEIQLTAVCLNDIIDIIKEQFKPMAEMKGLQLTVDSKEQLELIADRDRLHQLLVILVDNAVKYTFPPGQITLSCYRQSNNIVIRVEDTGCGIPPEDLPRVFDRFFRGDKSRSRETGGTGLGLAIAEWIVERHGGKLKVDSQVGIGTQFTIILPIRK